MLGCGLDTHVLKKYINMSPLTTASLSWNEMQPETKFRCTGVKREHRCAADVPHFLKTFLPSHVKDLSRLDFSSQNLATQTYSPMGCHQSACRHAATTSTLHPPPVCLLFFCHATSSHLTQSTVLMNNLLHRYGQHVAK